MAAALGLSKKSREDRGPYWLDVRDFGVVADDGGAYAAQNALGIQAAIDRLSPASSPGRTAEGMVYFPPAKQAYRVDRPLYVDWSSVSFSTDFRGGAKVRAYQNCGPVFLLSMQRVPNNQALTPDHLVDLYGKLDATAAPAAGQRWGFATQGDSIVSQGSGPFSFSRDDHDYWAGTRLFTLDFALDYAVIPPAAAVAYFGSSTAGNPQPWMVYQSGGKVYFAFRITDGTWMGGRNLSASFAAPAAGAVRRISVQVDLAAATVHAWIDGIQVALIDVPNPAYFDVGAGCRFIKNGVYVFKVGGQSPGGNQISSDYQSFDPYPANAVNCYGLKVSTALQYVPSTTGSAQVRVDGRTSTDFIRYFEYRTQETLALFEMTDSPAQVAADRFCKVTFFRNPWGKSKTQALYVSANHGSTFSATGWNKFENLIIEADDSVYGDALCVGFNLYLRAKNCTFRGGAHGIGSWRWGANYEHHIDECTLSGVNAALFSHYGSWKCDHTHIERHGRSTIWGSLAGIYMRRTFCTDQGQPESVCRLDGCNTLLDDFGSDIESGPYPSRCAIWAGANPSTGDASSAKLVIRDLGFGTIPDRTPVILLEDYPGQATALPLQSQSNQGVFRLDNLTVFGLQPETLVKVVGQAWVGDLTTQIQPIYPPIVNAAGVGNITSHHDRFVAPPRTAAWNAGNHRLNVPCPADGQYSRWRCTRSGAYGTATTPRWQGYDPPDAGVGGLACYVRSHAYMLGGAGTVKGMLADLIWAEALGRILGGVVGTTTTTGVAVALNTRYAYRGGGITEVSGGSYARASIPLASWSAGAAGATSNLVAATFPTSTADWGTVRSLVLFDQGSGRQLAQVEVPPFATGVGAVVSYPISSLALAWTDPAGGFSPAWRSAIAAAYFRGIPLPAPAAVYVALSTAPADSTAGPTEPAGGSYARVAAPAASWRVGAGNAQEYVRGNAANVVPLAFPAPTGPWGNLEGANLMDAPSGGNVIAAADLTLPRDIVAGGPAPTFAIGAFWLTVG